jgi:hypothetical protein
MNKVGVPVLILPRVTLHCREDSLQRNTPGLLEPTGYRAVRAGLRRLLVCCVTHYAAEEAFTVLINC